MVLTMVKGRVVERRGAKFGNVQTQYRGNSYDSQAESNYAMFLDSEMANGRVRAWSRQIPIELFLNGVDICTYVADFKVEYADGRVEYVDVKGYKTDVYKLKKKIVHALRGIIIKEIPAKDLKIRR